MRNREQLVKAIIGIMGLSLLIALVGVLIRVIIPTDSWPDKRVSYSVVKTNGVLEELWSQSNLFATSHMPCCPLMAAAKGKVFIVGRFDRPGNTAVLAFDGASGALLWRSNRSDGDAGLFATSSALYTGSYGVGRIVAHDLDTGQILWSSRMPRARYIKRFRVIDNLIYVLSSSGHHFVRADTGKILQTFTGPPTAAILEEVATELVLTSTTQIKPEYFEEAVFAEDVMIIQSGGDVWAVDHQTRDIVWETEETVISNVAATGSAIYLLTIDRKLLGFDPRNGEVMASVQFEPSSFEFGSTSAVNAFATAYYVAVDADAGLLYAFLGNGAQMFAFRIVDTPGN